MQKILLLVVAVVAALLVAIMAAGYFLFSGDAIRAAIEQQASSWLGQPVRIGEARVGLFPRASVRLRDIEVGEPAQVTLADVQLSTDLGALLGRRIEDARVVIADSVIQMPLPFAIPTGDDAARAGEDDGAAAIELVSVSEISLRDVRIQSRGREVTISADSALAANHLTLERFDAESGGTSLTVTGEVDLDPVNAQLRASANLLDLDELIALAEAFTPEPSTGSGRSGGSTSELPHISAQLTAESATAAGVELSALTADMDVDGDRVRLSPLAFGLFGGRYEGTLDARVGDTMSLTLDSRLEGLDVAQLAAFGGSPDTITGTLAGQGRFTARGADMAAALAGASGSGSATIADGTIRRLGLLRTVVLFFGNPAPETADSTDSFERIETTFSLARQVFSAESFSMRSRDADVTGAGTLALEGKVLDGAVQLLLSEELSAQAGSNVSRYTLEGNRVVLPARLGGTLDEPRITIDAGAAIRRGIRNEVGRRLRGLFGGGDPEQ